MAVWLDRFVAALAIRRDTCVVIAAMAGFTGLHSVPAKQQKSAVHLGVLVINEQMDKAQTDICLRWERQPD